MNRLHLSCALAGAMALAVNPATADEHVSRAKDGWDYSMSAAKLASLCEAMKAVDVSVFQIIGHTDSSGSASYNENLSLLRAKEVKRHLISSCGIASERLEAIGLGESAPYNADDPGSDVNRRVEFQALG